MLSLTVKQAKQVMRIVGLALIYGLLARMVLTYTLANGNVTILWLPGGVALAALLLGGKKLWPGVFIGATVAGLMMRDPLWVSLLIASGNTLETLCAAWLLSRINDFDTNIDKPRDLLILTLVALLSCWISALIGPLTLTAAKIIPAQTILINVMNWWQADCIGILLGTPLILIWQHTPQGWLQRSRVIETVTLFVSSFLVGQIVFLEWFQSHVGHLSMGYWLYLFVTWAALRYGRHGVSLIVTLVSIQAFEGARHGKGFFGHDMAETGLQNYWFYILVLTTVGLFLALTLEARKKTEQKLRVKSNALMESESRFRSLATTAPVVIYRTDADGKYIFVNDTWRELTGFPGESTLGNGWDTIIHSEDRERVYQERNTAFESNQVFKSEYRITTATGNIKDLLGRAIPQYDETGILQGYVGTLTDITEHKRLEKEMEDTGRRKDEFLAMLAHELRNPLAPISNAVHILKRGASDPARITWCSDIIDRQMAHLIRLVDDLLDISRISRGLIVLNKESLEIRDFILSAVESCQPLIDARRQELTLDLPPQFLRVEGDRIRLAQVISNLINNAAKFTEEGGHIGLSVELSGDKVCIRVRDTGCGICPADLYNLFELFYQADRSLDRSQGGLGVGLSIVRNLVAMHGGDVQAFSPGLGQGSEFMVRLPQLIPLEPVPTHTSAPAAPIQRKLHILVVDDNWDVADSLALLLKIEGYHVQTTYDGPTALEMARTEQPDVVLLDIGMPGMDGYTVAKAFRQCSDLARIKLIAVTGYGRPEDREKSFAAGFDGHLTKPLDCQLLQKLLDDYRINNFHQSP